MSIEKNIERMAAALERIAESLADMDLATTGKTTQADKQETPAEPVKKKAVAKKEAVAKKDPAPQPGPSLLDETGEEKEGKSNVVSIAAKDDSPVEMTPEELNRGLMEVAKGVSPAVVNQIFQILKKYGAENTSQVPAARRADVLNEAKALAGGDTSAG